MDWIRFEREVDSFLQTPREMNEENFPVLLLNKATQLGLDLNPDDIDFRVTATDRDTHLSRKFAFMNSPALIDVPP